MFEELFSELPCFGEPTRARSPRTGRRRWILPLVLILCGGLLVLAPWTIQLDDGRIARARGLEADAWVDRYGAALAGGANPTPAHPTVVTPGSEGYLLEIPRIGLRAVVRELEPAVFSGRNTPALKRYGLGQVPYTRELRNVSPGAEGTAAIAGHRTTSGAPFRHIDRLKPGDLIIVRKTGTEQRWIVVNSVTVRPSAVDAIKSRPGIRSLVILACSPPFSARERLIVYARLQ